MSDADILVFRFSEPATADEHREIQEYLQHATPMGYTTLLLPSNLEMLNADEIEIEDIEDLKNALDYNSNEEDQE